MKLKSLISESNLGELPSSKLFKFNKETGKYDKPMSEGKLDLQYKKINADLDHAVNAFQLYRHELTNSIITPKELDNYDKALKNLRTASAAMQSVLK